ncbi:hypothetical protein [Bacillus suaedae]|uniref:Uncharacterized protein n=1 Tax=Halalkalibacter suaedae TaxID=2822140 RepID=A0A941AQG4_9BACI|nr:hypothetical protein [Bacillus suaedae]MBP3951163.1 hypothetical protein [Bacillus suaedae]
MNFRKVLSIGILLSSFIIPFFVLSRVSYNSPMDETLIQQLNEHATLLSWLFTGIIGFISFTSLFIALIFENKLVVAANTLKRIYFPYTFNIKDLKNAYINYDTLTLEDRILNGLFYSFIAIGIIVSTIWGVVVGFYTQFRLSFELDLTLTSMFVFGIYVFWVILIFLFFLIGLVIHQIRFNKNPFSKGNLPGIKKITDVDFLISQEIDIPEFFSINYPKLIFYQNPPVENPSYELNIELPLGLNNLRFLIKVYQNQKVVAKCYGVLEDVVEYNNIGKDYTTNITTNFEKDLYKSLLSNNSYGELFIYNDQFQPVARFFLKKTKLSEGNFCYTMERKIEITGKILDKGIFLNQENKPIELEITN